MSIIDAIVVVIVVALGVFAGDVIAQKYCLKKLKEAMAVSQESTVTPQEARIDIGPMTESALRRLVKRKKVMEVKGEKGEKRYYVIQ